MRNNQGDQVTTAAVAAIAAASQIPFKTAFKIYMGIFAAQLVALLCVGVLITVAVLLIKG